MSNRMRMSGINSGMDTQSIVEQLVEVKSKKKEKLKKQQTKLEWKQDAWKSLNSKLFSLYNEQFGTLKLQGSFKNKKASIVDTSIASVTADSNAVNGTQTLAVKQLSKTAYITGDDLGSNIKGSTKLSEVVGADAFTQKLDGAEENNAIALKVYKNKSDANGKDVVLTSDMTMDQVASALNDAGLTASFDSNNHRFFISSKTEGDNGNFRIAATGGAAGNILTGKESELTDEKDIAAFRLLSGLKITETAAGDGFITGQNAQILLNGAEFESSSNLFQVNGLNITATKVSEKGADGKYITTNVSTQTDVDGAYNMIKDFFKKYNEIINEMDKLYNSKANKDYEPLTSEEKDAMSEEEVKEWETKIKDSLLSRDDNLRTLISTLKEGMAKAVTLENGKTYSLTSFGINTLSYFEAADNEKGAYHIDGDSDDDKTKGNDDKLRAALTNNLDDTMNFFNQLAKGVYDALGKQMQRVPDYRSFQTLYDDKMLQKEYDDLTADIKKEEDYLSDYEDKWYDKFAAMEKAMEKVNSKSNALAGLFGTG
ncbi:MAG: flagellar filament capping protein FliD [Lachnospiraceae bacterium]|nr:flagellar filament capping protein FliD [Lachnospiraceae bacterium]